MAITHEQLGDDEDLAREILVVARDIAPCLGSLTDEAEKDALSILKRVYKYSAARGSRDVKAQSIGPASVSYADIESAFDGQPRRALRSLCGAAAGGGMPRGSFPAERPISRLWPES
ncbi:MAG: hypothetical protein LBE05_05750 [Microbacterium sp.]|nr:hypothetical protein [Microbacterium sp.]